MVDQCDRGKTHGEETKDILQADGEAEYETFLFHYPSSREEWSQPEIQEQQEDLYTPMK